MHLLPVVRWGVIAREERYLDAKFGAEYQAYRARVRRWFSRTAHPARLSSHLDARVYMMGRR